jgi:hypothetical protein
VRVGITDSPNRGRDARATMSTQLWGGRPARQWSGGAKTVDSIPPFINSVGFLKWPKERALRNLFFGSEAPRNLMSFRPDERMRLTSCHSDQTSECASPHVIPTGRAKRGSGGICGPVFGVAFPASSDPTTSSLITNLDTPSQPAPTQSPVPLPKTQAPPAIAVHRFSSLPPPSTSPNPTLTQCSLANSDQPNR